MLDILQGQGSHENDFLYWNLIEILTYELVVRRAIFDFSEVPPDYIMTLLFLQRYRAVARIIFIVPPTTYPQSLACIIIMNYPNLPK